jgi:cyclopropane-fatty-acyl-phospholipid synthase
MPIFNPLAGITTSVLSTITSQTWGPLLNLCKNGTLSELQDIKIGKLVVFEGGSSKASHVFGSDKEGVPVAFLDVHNEKFWVRLALFADMVRQREEVYANDSVKES